ncbi:MAG TPA: hypothetical protein VGF13_05585 [Verrucomicrobiae bacterium]|jgi:hypothetical protein
MKRKLIFISAVALLILAAVVVIAGRGGSAAEKRRMNDELVLTPEGKLVVQPGERTKATFVVSDKTADKTNAPAPPR